jgi:hypothetical protein
MVTPLLDRQVSLLEYLTSGDAIFGVETDASFDQALQGLDLGMLRLEACFSHEKRMEKINAVFPSTFRLLGADQAEIVRGFTEACPPIDISRIENARQFYDFLCVRWWHRTPQPQYLRDVAACEFSCAKARVEVEGRELAAASDRRARRNVVRRHPGVVLLRCDYDVRQIFESGGEAAVPIKRDTLLAIVNPPDVQHPKVFEVLPAVFDLLTVLDAWTDRSVLASMPELDEIIRELEEHALIEVRL